MLGFHKGMLAFGVELDSFCERETEPAEVSIANIGMASLVSSKLYGTRGLCSDPGTPVPNCNCGGQSNSTACTNHDDGGSPTPTSCGCTWANTGGNGPGKHNFIGFGGPTAINGCSTGDVANTQILGTDNAGVGTTADALCQLGVSNYDLGVYGHIAGSEAFGVSVNEDGVLSSEQSIDPMLATANAGC